MTVEATQLGKVNPNDGHLQPKDETTYLLLHGPNHNLFGRRDPTQYGTTTLQEIEERVTALGKELGVNIVCAQSNYEGEMVEYIHYARRLAGVVCNPGAYAHYGYALRDAVDCLGTVPFVEVHISNVYQREEFRHKSVTAPKAAGYICGAGIMGYELGLRCAVARAAEAKSKSA